MPLNLLSGLATRIPIAWTRPLSGVSLIVPYYHMVSDIYVPHVSNLYKFKTATEFKEDVDYLLKNYVPVTLQEIVDALNGKCQLPHACFHLTFDDGFSEMHDVVAPVLHKAGIPATFFLTTTFLDEGGLAHHNILSVLLDKIQKMEALPQTIIDRISSVLPADRSINQTLRERILSIGHSQKTVVDSLAEILQINLNEYVHNVRPYLTSTQVDSMIQMGFSIGSHSCDHPLYADLPPSDQIQQTKKSIEQLRVRFHVKPKAFAFPHTDGGVKEDFFREVYSERLLDVSFGTSGLVRHFHPRNIERVSMENTSGSAKQILARQFARAVYYRMR
jgi:peptidoglycan/xylan/chitin deacetylase (PgdA/CDA1 family)